MKLLILLLAFAVGLRAAPVPQPLGNGLYAYISDNDGSCNSTFLVGSKYILVVDTGFDDAAGHKLLTAIRSVSSLPVRYIINTHYHRDHQAANAIVGPDADVISTGATRERTMALLAHDKFYKPASITTDQADIFIDDQRVHLEFHGPAHTMGDLVVEFPAQKVIATGDLFLNHSVPAMDKGSVLNWIHILDQLLATPALTFVPGHFGLGTRDDFQHFRDYLAALRDQVSKQVAAGASWDQTRQALNMTSFSDMRQFPQYQATYETNARVLYDELTRKK